MTLTQDFKTLRNQLPRCSANCVKRGVGILDNPPFLSPKSLNDFISWTKSLWRYAELSYDEVLTNPTVALMSFKNADEGHRDVVANEHLAKWLAVSKERLLVATLSLTGMRLGELAGMRKEDVDVSSRSLYVRPNAWRRLKTSNASRQIPIHSEIDCEALREAVPFARTQSGLTLLSKRLNYELDGIIDSPTVTVHSLRHRFATELKELGAEDSLVADLLGHKLGTMTSRYAKPSSLERKREWVQRLTLPVVPEAPHQPSEAFPCARDGARSNLEAA
jgi:integrase